MSFATPAEMLQRYDAQAIGDLVSDTATQVTAAGLLTDANLQAALDDASGAIEAALLVGARYTVADLTALTGNAEKHLIRINCDIAKAYLLRRRISFNPEKDKAEIELAEWHLEQLRSGDAIFGITTVIAASEPLLTGPSTVDFQNMNLIRNRTRNYYPAQRLPFNR